MTKRKTTPTKKKPVAKTRSKKQTAPIRSFRIAPQDTPFMTLKLTRESIYWIVLGIVVVAFAAWIMKLQSDIQSLYDAIELNESLVVDMPTQHKQQN